MSHPSLTHPALACALLALAQVACDEERTPRRTAGWVVHGPAAEGTEIELRDGYTRLSLPPGEKGTETCHPLDITGHSRGRLDWVWQVGTEAPAEAVILAVASYLDAEGRPIRGPGGQQRLLTLRGQQVTGQHHTETLLSSPGKATSARLCLQLRSFPQAQLGLGAPELRPVEPVERANLPNLLVVVVDALRADTLGAYGAPPGSSPEVDRLSERALVFPRAWTQYTWTGPSFISYMSSRWARSHGWVASWADRSSVRPKPGTDVRTLPSVLRDAGYLTVGLNANGYLDWLDASQLGFDQWSFEGDTPAVQAALRELSYWPDDGRPNFLYLHLMATHHPLCPSPESQGLLGISVDTALLRGRDNKCPRGGLTQSAADYAEAGLSEAEHLEVYQAAYRAAVLDADANLGRLLASLEEHGLQDNTVVVFTSDHGELLGEHGVNGHGPWVWEPLARVPLIIAGPGVQPGRHEQGVARLIDLAPTLLDALGLPDRQPEPWQGRSLLQPSATPPLAVTEREGWVAYTADGRLKRIDRAEGSELVGHFDLGEDPGELAAIQADTSGDVHALDQRSRAWLADTPVVAPEGNQAGPELEEVLRGLGYLD